MKPEDMNMTAMKIFLWSGVVLVMNLIIAQHLISGFVPPPSPSLSAREIADIYIARSDRILVGCLIQIVSWSCYGIWATPIILLIRKSEGTWPLFTYASLINLGGCAVYFVLWPVTCAVIAFRATTLDPSVIQVMNDWVWFDWLYTWPPYTIWMFILATAILTDKHERTVYPRWVGYFNIWSGVLIFPAAMIGFFKTGPFAYDGAISFWLASVVYFAWMVVMTVMTFRALDEQRQAQGLPADAALVVT
jgi:hypothetical protein